MTIWVAMFWPVVRQFGWQFWDRGETILVGSCKAGDRAVCVAAFLLVVLTETLNVPAFWHCFPSQIPLGVFCFKSNVALVQSEPSNFKIKLLNPWNSWFSLHDVEQASFIVVSIAIFLVQVVSWTHSALHLFCHSCSLEENRCAWTVDQYCRHNQITRVVNHHFFSNLLEPARRAPLQAIVRRERPIYNQSICYPLAPLCIRA